MSVLGGEDKRPYVHAVCYRDDAPDVYYYMLARDVSHDDCRAYAKKAGMGKKWMLFWADWQIPQESKEIADLYDCPVYRQVTPQGKEIDRFLQTDKAGVIVQTEKILPVRVRVRQRPVAPVEPEPEAPTTPTARVRVRVRP